MREVKENSKDIRHTFGLLILFLTWALNLNPNCTASMTQWSQARPERCVARHKDLDGGVSPLGLLGVFSSCKEQCQQSTCKLAECTSKDVGTDGVGRNPQASKQNAFLCVHVCFIVSIRYKNEITTARRLQTPPLARLMREGTGGGLCWGNLLRGDGHRIAGAAVWRCVDGGSGSGPCRKGV